MKTGVLNCYLVDGIVLHIANAECPAVVETEHQLVSSTEGKLPVDVLPVDLVSEPEREESTRRNPTCFSVRACWGRDIKTAGHGTFHPSLFGSRRSCGVFLTMSRCSPVAENLFVLMRTNETY